MAVVLVVNKTVGVVVAIAEAAIVSVVLAVAATLPRLWPCRCGRGHGHGSGGCARDRRDRGRACEAGSFGAAVRAAGRDGCQARQERDADQTKLETDVSMC